MPPSRLSLHANFSKVENDEKGIYKRIVALRHKTVNTTFLCSYAYCARFIIFEFSNRSYMTLNINSMIVLIHQNNPYMKKHSYLSFNNQNQCIHVFVACDILEKNRAISADYK